MPTRTSQQPISNLAGDLTIKKFSKLEDVFTQQNISGTGYLAMDALVKAVMGIDKDLNNRNLQIPDVSREAAQKMGREIVIAFNLAKFKLEAIPEVGLFSSDQDRADQEASESPIINECLSKCARAMNNNRGVAEAPGWSNFFKKLYNEAVFAINLWFGSQVIVPCPVERTALSFGKTRTAL